HDVEVRFSVLRGRHRHERPFARDLRVASLLREATQPDGDAGSVLRGDDDGAGARDRQRDDNNKLAHICTLLYVGSDPDDPNSARFRGPGVRPHGRRTAETPSPAAPRFAPPSADATRTGPTRTLP